jgi:hypothetical protein
MKFINLIKESNIDTELKEDITSGSVIVYHRTGRKGSPVQGIAADGYRFGDGIMYGYGVYTTYDFDSQLEDYMRETYGNIIIESKVISMQDFLIFDYDIAKRIYGNKNYTLSRQLRLILGDEFKKINIEIIKKLEEKLNVTKYTSDIAKYIYINHKEIINKLRGIVFTGGNDGKVLLSYDRKNVEPIRYTIDEGKTWKNVINKNIYQRLKGYDDDSKNLTQKRIESKLESGVKLDDYDIEFIKNNLKFFNDLPDSVIVDVIRKHDNIYDILKNDLIISKFNSKILSYIIRLTNDNEKIYDILLNNDLFLSNLKPEDVKILYQYSRNPIQLHTILKSKGKNFLSNIENDQLYELISYSVDKRGITNILVNDENFISNMSIDTLKHILKFSYDSDIFINKIKNKNKNLLFSLTDKVLMEIIVISHFPKKVMDSLGKYGYNLLSNLDSNDVNYILNYSHNMKENFEIIFSNEKIISNLNNESIKHIIEGVHRKIDVIVRLISNKKITSNLDSNTIKYIINITKSNSNSDPDKVFDLLMNSKNIRSNLDINDIYDLFIHSSYPKKIIKQLGKKSVEFLKDFEEYVLEIRKPLHAELYLKNVRNPKEIKEIMIKIRPDLFDNNLQENIKRIKRLL